MRGRRETGYLGKRFHGCNWTTVTPEPTSLPRDGGGVDVETGEFPDFLFRQGVGIGLIYSQFLTMKGEKCDRF